MNVNYKPVVEAVENLMVAISKMIERTDISKMINGAMLPLMNVFKDLEENRKNPESIISYFDYMKKLSKYYWAFPYDIAGEELKGIFENVNTEKEFDQYIQKYFTKERTKQLFKDIEDKITEKEIFKQIKFAFENECYALINNSVISIIDNELGYYIYDKTITKRKDVFKPILDIYKNVPINECNWFNVIILEMLNNNINVIFENIKFDKIQISTEKKVRRHTSQHGKLFSNEKVDSLMLINTLYNIIFIKDYLEQYKDRLKLNKSKNEFYIAEQEKKKIKQKTQILEITILQKKKSKKNESKIIQYIIELAIAIISGIVVAFIVYKFNLQ